MKEEEEVLCTLGDTSSQESSAAAAAAESSKHWQTSDMFKQPAHFLLTVLKPSHLSKTRPPSRN